ncbi:MAG TPA: VOC family protein, partial [Rudaea sp.]|nr:VOC family protein [Rudaea sp.]
MSKPCPSLRHTCKEGEKIDRRLLAMTSEPRMICHATRRNVMNTPTPRVTPFLWFDTQAEEAARFYAAIFPNSQIGTVMRYDKAAAAA